MSVTRQPARSPAWRFTIAGLGWQASEVAVAPSALAAIPEAGPVPAAGRNTPGVDGLAAVSADGRTLTLSFTTGECVAAWGAYRYETARTVVVGSWEKASADSGPCPLDAVLRTGRVTLTGSLGTRVVLDVASGRPLAPGFQTPP